MPEPQTAVFQESKARFPRPYVSKIVGRSSSWLGEINYPSGQIIGTEKNFTSVPSDTL
jgi:hypothetical protein